jgi:hypothetical protein
MPTGVKYDPCPFCRSHSVGFADYLGGARIACQECGAEGPVVRRDPQYNNPDIRRDAAATLWNRRPRA